MPQPRNDLERAYRDHLIAEQQAGRIRSWSYESTTYDLSCGNLRPINRCTYTPDYTVIANDGVTEQHEVKGHWREDAAIKFKLAASQHPECRFYIVTKHNKRTPWKIKQFLLAGQTSPRKRKKSAPTSSTDTPSASPPKPKKARSKRAKKSSSPSYTSNPEP